MKLRSIIVAVHHQKSADVICLPQDNLRGTSRKKIQILDVHIKMEIKVLHKALFQNIQKVATAL